MSVLLVWTAIAIYALAFIAYAVDLARRRRQVAGCEGRRASASSSEPGSAPSAGAASARRRSAELRARSAPPRKRSRRRPARTPRAAVGADRHVADGARVPLPLRWTSRAASPRAACRGRTCTSSRSPARCSSSRSTSACCSATTCGSSERSSRAWSSCCSAARRSRSTSQIVPLMDPLKSRLARHPRVRRLARDRALLARVRPLGGCSSCRRVASARVAAPSCARRVRRPTGQDRAWRFLRTLPSSEALESLAYRFAIIGFIFWTFTLIAGSIWANDAWGRYWGFDTKEVWTFVIWVLYAGYIHARATRGWRGIAVGVAVDRRLLRGAVQLHDREHVLQGPARLQRPALTRRSRLRATSRDRCRASEVPVALTPHPDGLLDRERS